MRYRCVLPFLLKVAFLALSYISNTVYLEKHCRKITPTLSNIIVIPLGGLRVAYSLGVQTAHNHISLSLFIAER